MARVLEDLYPPLQIALWKELSKKLSWAVCDTLHLSTENKIKVKVWSRGLASQLLNRYLEDVDGLAPPPDTGGAGGGAAEVKGRARSTKASASPAFPDGNRPLDVRPELLEAARKGLTWRD